MKRNINVDINDILSLIHCAEDYGFSNDVLFCSFRDWLGNELSDDDIENFAKEYLTDENREQGYSEEDYESAIEVLNEFKQRYIK